MKILIAVSQPVLGVGVRRTLIDDGFEVVSETTAGPNVVTLVGQLEPDVVLLDMHMPHAPGLWCLERIRELHPDTKVVAFSATADLEEVQDALARGACGYVTKSVDPGALGRAIREATGGRDPVVLTAAITGRGAVNSAGLTETESAVLRAIARGKSNAEIARDMSVTVQTIKFHLGNIYRKLEVQSRTEAVSWAYTNGLPDHPEAPSPDVIEAAMRPRSRRRAVRRRHSDGSPSKSGGTR